MPLPHDRPSVSVLLPVLNEADFIDLALGDLTRQDYGGELEIIVADGGSTDGTHERLKEWSQIDPRVVLIENPKRRQAYGLNLAAGASKGEILIRADGHTRFAPSYVQASVEALEETGAAVGGRMFPVGRTPFGRAVAAAMKSPWTIGPGRFHHSTVREEVDTVYLGALAREQFEALGGFRDLPSGSSEDADFYYRWRQSGRRVFIDPAIVSEYTPRDTPTSLWIQYFRYGQGKAEMLWLNRRLPSARPLAPLALILGLVVTVAIGVTTSTWLPFAALAGVWLVLLASVAARAEEPVWRVCLAAAIMHLGYGSGVLLGLLRGSGDSLSD